jgi:geranylgeranyl diphosphate synthase, type I
MRDLRLRVDAALSRFLDQEAQRIRAISDELTPVADQLRVSLAGGKRLRAAFCYWGWRGAGQPDCEGIVKAAAAIELVHTAGLVHDDIIDRSELRRGAPAAHVTLGTELALVAGDLLIAMAGQLFAESGLPPSFLRRAMPMWFTLARELAAGVCLEILSTSRPPTTERALRIARYKTAKYTVEQPLLIGGLAGGADQRTLDAFTAYGLPLGEAFQLRDDLLGVFGDPRRTGKPDDGDLRDRKPTALLAQALTRAEDADRKELTGLLEQPEPLDQRDLRTVRDILIRTGAREAIEELIAHRAAEAVRAITRARLVSDAAAALTSLVPALTAREV